MARHTGAEGYRDELAQCPDSDISPPENGAVFYSDKEGKNFIRAQEYALAETERGHPCCVLEQTQYGRKLHAEDLFNDPDFSNHDARAVWGETSSRYARNASGDVTAFVTGATEHSVFREDEFPILIQNAKVRSINGVSREELATLYERDPKAAFDRVCEMERVLEEQAPSDRSPLTPSPAEPTNDREKELAMWRAQAPLVVEEPPPTRGVERENVELEVER